MAKKKFTQLVDATLPLVGTEVIALVQGGQSKKATVADLGTTGISIIKWDFSAHAGAYPTDPDALYVVIDGSVLPENTWMVANTPTPSGSGDFFYK